MHFFTTNKAIASSIAVLINVPTELVIVDIEQEGQFEVVVVWSTVSPIDEYYCENITALLLLGILTPLLLEINTIVTALLLRVLTSISHY